MSLIITVSRQLGAGGSQIASRVASQLGLALVDRQILDRVSEEAGVPSGVVEAVDESPAATKERPRGVRRVSADITYNELIQSAIYDLAHRGDVLVLGRGANLLLKDRPGLLRVKIVAPLEIRIESLMQRLSLSRAAAERAVQDSDKSRSSYIRKAYNADWMDPLLYDVILNTATLSYELAAAIICAAADPLRS